MAEGQSGEKSEEASPQKLRKAREKGQVMKSTDLVSVLVFLGSFGALYVSIGYASQQMMGLITDSVSIAQRGELLPSIAQVMRQAFFVMMVSSIPVVASALLFGLIGNYIQVGFLFTFEPLTPKLEKINPVKGLKQLFSVRRLVETLKQLVKFSLVAYIVYKTLREDLRDVIVSQRTELYNAVTLTGIMIKDIVLKVAFAFLVIGLADYFWQRRVFNKSMMMSKYEVKQEYKESEGDPQLKGERQRLAQELGMHGSQQNVKNSDAVVTNPAHIAVAIKYDPTSNRAPYIVAKGIRKNAEKIKELARFYKIEIVRNVPLAQALNRLDINEEIPENLYKAVAEVLHFVYELKKSEA